MTDSDDKLNAALRTIFESFPSGVSLFDAELNLVAWNRQFEIILKLTRFHGHFPTERESPKCPKPNHRTRPVFASKWSNWSEAVANLASCPKNLAATPQAS